MGAPLVEWDHAGKTDLLAAVRAAELVRSTRAELVHTHSRPVDLWAGLGARFSGVPAVATLHAEPGRAPDGSVRAGLRARAHGAVLDHVHGRVIAVAEDIARLASERLALRLERTSVVENGVDLEALAMSAAARASARASLGIAPDEVAFGCIARFVDSGSEEKGQPDIVRALARTRAQFVLHFVGDGASEASVRALARELGVADRVRFHGARPSAEVVRGLDLLVLASRSEGCPYVVLEALAGGVPVLATTVGGIPVLLDGGRAGALVPPRDAEALAQSLDRLASSENERRLLAEAGLARARARYGLLHFARATSHVYRSVLAQGVLA
jgi:glycosyltransferase involved in cell wall biosynthesis